MVGCNGGECNCDLVSYFEASNITQRPVKLPFEVPTSGVMGGEAPLEAGIAKAGRAGTSHSLLTVLMVSNVPILEEVEIDGALDLIRHSFM